MWIHGTARLIGVTLLGLQISIIALASAASAAPKTSEPGRTPQPINQTYQLEGETNTGHWYATLDEKPHPVKLDRAKPRRAPIRISHTQAVSRLDDAGVRAHSSGKCASRTNATCTSLQAVRTATVNAVIALRRDSRCRILVTGGTERGHAPGHFSHQHGYKLDITHNRCIDRYITGNYPYTATRGDGAALYRSPAGAVYARESDHWDILFR
ncbi:MAG: hypothetical protein HOV83_32115 [Catenulispora sp.]|nr:hypothetical protein [Catenulispora sp.]